MSDTLHTEYDCHGHAWLCDADGTRLVSLPTADIDRYLTPPYQTLDRRREDAGTMWHNERLQFWRWIVGVAVVTAGIGGILLL